MSFSDDDLDAAGRRRDPKKKRPKGKIPYPPDRSESLSAVRDWLSDSCGLPAEVRIEIVVRPGREPEDPLTIVLSNGMKLRTSHQSRLQQARTLQAFLASESDGIAQAPYLSPAEVGDVYTGLCRLGTASARSDPVADLHERLAMFVEIADEVIGSLNPAQRFVTIEALRKRPAFDRSTALAMKAGKVEHSPVLLVDGLDDGRRYVRASEWVAYLRFVHGQTVNESGLVARMAELDSDRVDPQAWNSDRTRKVHLVFYTVPEGL